MTLNLETQRVGQEGINITAACCNLSPDLFGDSLKINYNFKYLEKLWCYREKCSFLNSIRTKRYI